MWDCHLHRAVSGHHAESVDCCADCANKLEHGIEYGFPHGFIYDLYGGLLLSFDD